MNAKLQRARSFPAIVLCLSHHHPLEKINNLFHELSRNFPPVLDGINLDIVIDKWRNCWDFRGVKILYALSENA